MAASATAFSGAGGNLLATLLAAANASLQRQQSSSNQSSEDDKRAHKSKTEKVQKDQTSDKLSKSTRDLEAKRETLCQLLNLKTQAHTSLETDSQSSQLEKIQLSNGSHKRTSSTKSKNKARADTNTDCTKDLLQNGNAKATPKHKSQKIELSADSKSQPNKASSIEIETEMRDLETWFDDDENNLETGCYKELADSNNIEGWKADDMFRFNEKMYKLRSTYTDKTLADKYTTSLPKLSNRKTRSLLWKAKKVAEEIEKGTGRITPESSDDDEAFEVERMKRLQHRRKQEHVSKESSNNIFNGTNFKKPTQIDSNKRGPNSSSINSNSTETPATASLSSSPPLNESLRPITSSSRNILRTCLSMT